MQVITKPLKPSQLINTADCPRHRASLVQAEYKNPDSLMVCQYCEHELTRKTTDITLADILLAYGVRSGFKLDQAVQAISDLYDRAMPQRMVTGHNRHIYNTALDCYRANLKRESDRRSQEANR